MVKLKESGLIKHWSYSRWKKYKDCPARFKFSVIDRIPEPQSKYAARGDQVHKAAEDYVARRTDTIDGELSNVADVLKALRKVEAYPEVKMGLTRDWQPTHYGFKHDMWFGIKIDLVADKGEGTAFVADWKTGKIRDDYELQVEIGALPVLIRWPAFERVETTIYFTDHGEQTDPVVIERSQLPELIERWEDRVAPMFHDRKFLPTPGDGCYWCPHSKKKGGPCRY